MQKKKSSHYKSFTLMAWNNMYQLCYQKNNNNNMYQLIRISKCDLLMARYYMYQINGIWINAPIKNN